jgi:hypothetical protein
MPFENILDRLRGQQPGTTKSVRELNKIHMTPKAKAAAFQQMRGAQGIGLGLTVSSLIPDQVYDRIGQEIVRGAVTVLGGDTTFMDARISGKPLVKSVGSTDFNVATDEGLKAYTKALKESKKTKTKTPEIKEPDIRTDSEERISPTNIQQKGRNFDSMAENIFKAMAERNANTGVAASTLSAMNSMNPVSKYSSTNLPATDTNVFTNTEGSTDSFENPGIAVNTGSVQPRETNVNFSSAGATQFERPVDMPSVITKPGPKNPVEYTNYMTSDLALGSMDALRMNEGQKRLIYASGQYWGEGADGKAVKVDRDLARKVKRGAEGADELLANFLGRSGLSATANSVVEAGTNYTPADYNSQGQLLNDRNLLTFKDGSQRYLSDIPEDEDLSATY